MNFYGFYTGQEFEAYEYLGAHLEGDAAVFRTFAPSAAKISLIGEFNDWTETPMEKVYDGNFWECTINGAVRGQMYKYRIYDSKGNCIDHCDPYGFWAELRPGTASRLYEMKGTYEFHDTQWQRKLRDPAHEPVNIYELQAGSWRVPDPADKERHYSYRELADLLIPYLQEMHYTHLELLPITEFPSDESWGYQATGFYAPTARYGTPDDLRCLIDQCHAAGIGVILDFVAVHFVANDYALMRYDGTSLYEYPSTDVGYSEWGTCNFMHSRGEVRSFLQSSVYYWLREFHFDGVRMDAVSNLIYWQGNEGRGTNQSAIQFLQTMNRGLKDRCPNALLIAEDSSAFPGVTKPVQDGGLGFDLKWDLGWMNDTLSYMKAFPFARKQQYHKLTFSIQYYYNERYLLPLSHDEVVHGKATIWQKMNGSDPAGKFAQACLLYTYMYAHPGKKLNFMGNELAGFYEWSEKKELDWWLLKDRPQNRQFHEFMRQLNEVYGDTPALWAEDYKRSGFEWTDCSNEGRNAVYAFVRRGRGQSVLAVFNFDDYDVYGYRTVIPAQDLTTDDSAMDGQSSSAPRTIFSCSGAQWREGETRAAENGAGETKLPVCGLTPAELDGAVFKTDVPGFSAQIFLLKNPGENAL